MRFIYEKEFVAQRSAPGRSRGGVVPEPRPEHRHRRRSRLRRLPGLGVIAALEPARRIRRVLIVGPGLDLAPRTALHEDSAPESYQPWAVIDALVSVGLSRLDDLTVVAPTSTRASWTTCAARARHRRR